jgi:hypothetical protein
MAASSPKPDGIDSVAVIAVPPNSVRSQCHCIIDILRNVPWHGVVVWNGIQNIGINPLATPIVINHSTYVRCKT